MTSTTAPALPDTPAELLRAVRDQKKAADKADVEMMRLTVHWADLHIADPESATMLGRTNDSAGRFLTDCVEVAYRLPKLRGAVLSGLVARWRAQIIAQTTLALTMEAATHVDEQVFWCASRLTPSQLGRVVDEARVRFMPAQVTQEQQDSADKRHVTFDTEQVSFDGTMHLEADLEIPDVLALAEAVKSGAEHLAKLGSTDTVDGRRATALGTWPATSSPSASTRTPEGASTALDHPVASIPTTPVTRVVLYAHLSADTITHPDTDTTSNGVTSREALCGRIEQAGQRLSSVEQIRAWCGTR